MMEVIIYAAGFIAGVNLILTTWLHLRMNRMEASHR